MPCTLEPLVETLRYGPRHRKLTDPYLAILTVLRDYDTGTAKVMGLCTRGKITRQRFEEITQFIRNETGLEPVWIHRTRPGRVCRAPSTRKGMPPWELSTSR